MLLTEQEVIKLWDSHTIPVFGKSGINPVVFAQLVESAVLEKLKAQEPVGYEWVETEKGLCISHNEPPEYEVYQVEPLYLHPLPPADVVRDATRVAELEAVLRECREQILNCAWELPNKMDEAIAKIDEVLNGPASI